MVEGDPIQIQIRAHSVIQMRWKLGLVRLSEMGRGIEQIYAYQSVVMVDQG